MGIDRHEWEHRVWRSSGSKSPKETDRDLAEQLDTSIVPGNNPSEDAVPSPKRVKREKVNQLR